MGVEIERRFLVAYPDWRKTVQRQVNIVQGYLRTKDVAVRVRIADRTGFITIKGPPEGLLRSEYEYEIPLDEAEQLIEEFCEPRVLHKTRNYLRVAEHEWTVDEFTAGHVGLVLAEVELSYPDEPIEMPIWLGEEVSWDPAYTSHELAKALARKASEHS